jgi:hypothetical protein
VENGRRRFEKEDELFSIVDASDGAVHKLSFWQLEQMESKLDPAVELGAWSLERRAVEIGGTRDVLLVARVTGKTMQTLRIVPLAGRGISPEDDRDGSAPVVVLSNALAKGLFGTASGSLGHTINLAGNPLTVVGVLPDGTALPRRNVNIWIAARPGFSIVVRSHDVALLDVVLRYPRQQYAATPPNGVGDNSDPQLSQQDFRRLWGPNEIVELWPLAKVLDGGWSSRWERIEFGLIAVAVLGASGGLVLVLADMLRRVSEWRLRLALGSSSMKFAWDVGRPYIATGVVAGMFGAGSAVFIAKQVAVISGLPDSGRSVFSILTGSAGSLALILVSVVASVLTVPALVLLSFPIRWETFNQGNSLRGGIFAPLLGIHVALVVGMISGVAMLGLAEVSAQKEAATIGCQTCLSIDVRRGTALVIGADREAISRVRQSVMDGLQMANVRALVSANAPGDGLSMREEVSAALSPPQTLAIHLVEPGDLSLLGIRPLNDTPASEMRDALGRGDVFISNLAARRLFGTRDPQGLVLNISSWAHTARVAGVVSDIAQDGLFRPIPPIVYVPFDVNPVPDFSITWDSLSASRDAVEKLLRAADPTANVSTAVNPEERSRAGSGNIATVFAWVTGVAALSLVVLLGATIGTAEVLFQTTRRTLAIRELLGQQRFAAWFAVVFAYLIAIAMGALIGLIATVGWIHKLLLPMAPISPFASRTTALGVAVLVAFVTAATLCSPALRQETESLADGLNS